jgi:hypothetical protein
VTFKDGNTVLATVNIDAFGKAKLTTSSLSASTHSITAVYSDRHAHRQHVGGADVRRQQGVIDRERDVGPEPLAARPGGDDDRDGPSRRYPSPHADWHGAIPDQRRELRRASSAGER